MLAAALLAIALAAPASSIDDEAHARIAAALERTALVAQAGDPPPDPLDAPPPPIETIDPAAPPPGLPPDVDDRPPPAAPPRLPPEAPYEDPPPDDERQPLDPLTAGVALFGAGAAMNCASLSCFVAGPVAYVAPCLYCLAFPAGIGALMTFGANALLGRDTGYLWPIAAMMIGNSTTFLVSGGLLLAGAFGSGLLLPTIPQNPVVLYGFGAAAGATVLLGTVGSAGAATAAYLMTSDPPVSAPPPSAPTPTPTEVRRAPVAPMRTAMAF